MIFGGKNRGRDCSKGRAPFCRTGRSGGVCVKRFPAGPRFSQTWIFKGQETGPNGTHGSEVFGDDKLIFREIENFEKCSTHARVSGNAALKSDRWLKRNASADGAFKVSRDRETETSDDIMIRGGDLLQVNHIALGKDAATPGNARGIFRLECKCSEFFNGKVEAVSLLI